MKVYDGDACNSYSLGNKLKDIRTLLQVQNVHNGVEYNKLYSGRAGGNKKLVPGYVLRLRRESSSSKNFKLPVRPMLFSCTYTFLDSYFNTSSLEEKPRQIITEIAKHIAHCTHMRL